MKIKITLASALFAAAASIASADSLYWVDSRTYTNGIDKSHNQPTDFNSNTESKWIGGVFKWATSAPTLGEDGKPVYSYADSSVVPDENTDVFFSFSGLTDYGMAGSPYLSDDITIKSLTVTGLNKEYMMMHLNNHVFSIKEDLTFQSAGWLDVWFFGAKHFDIQGNIVFDNPDNPDNPNNYVDLARDPASKITVGKDVIFKSKARLQFATKGTGTFQNAQSVVSGVARFNGTSASIYIGTKTKDAGEQFYSFGGVSGTNAAAKLGVDGTEGAVANSTLVLTNTDAQSFAGKLYDSYERSGSTVQGTLNIVMNGSVDGVQTFSGENTFTGYIQVESGKLLVKSAMDSTHGKLSLNGGSVGAIDSLNVSSAEWNGGRLSYFNSGNSAPELIAVAGDFAKNASGKIVVDFNGFDASEVVDDDIWFDILSAGSLTGFSDDANDDFGFTGLGDDSIRAIFKWSDSGSSKMLSVSFATVPEPAAIAAVLGAVALAFAVRRGRK